MRQQTLLQQSFNLNSADLSNRVVKSAGLVFFGIALRTGITIGSTAVLARLLLPADFGYLAMATIMMDLAALFANFGFSSVLIQRQVVSRLHFDTIFWASLALGGALSIFTFIASFLAIPLFGSPVSGELLRVLCISFLVNSLTIIPFSVLSRMMMFRHILICEVVMLIARASTAIWMAWLGWGVWSLVAGSIVGVIAQVATYLIFVRYWPRFRFNRTLLQNTWRTNGAYFGGGVLFFVNSNIDLILIGRTLGATALGYYQNARSLTDEIRSRIAMPLQRVLFPAFSALQLHEERFRDGVMRSGRLLALIVLPIGFGISAVAEELVPVLYGPQWLPMIPIVELIAISSGFRAASTVGSAVFNATNRVGLSFRLNLISTLLTIVCISVGSVWGLIGVSYGLLLVAGVSLVMYRVAIGYIGMTYVHLWQMLGPPTLASFAMASTIHLARRMDLLIECLPVIQLGAWVILGGLIYLILMLFIAPHHVADFRSAISKLKASN